MTSPGSAANVRLFLAVVLVTLNLRAAITSVPPLVATIEAELGISGAVAGGLTALPVLCMGVFAPLAAALAHRIGREAAVAGALVVLAAGLVVRLGGEHLAVLSLGALLGGVGIAVCGTLLPGIVKEYFPRRGGVMTGVYMFSMTVGAAAASGVSVPLAGLLGGWPRALASWSLLAVVGLLAWLPVVRGARGRRGAGAPTAPRQPLPWRSRTAWLVAAYLATMSWQFYSQVAWLAPAREARGWSAASAGALVAVYQVAQLASGVGGPALTQRVRDRRLLLWPSVALMLLALVGLTLAPDAAPWLWTVLLGFGAGGGFAIGLVLLVDYAATPAAAARLSGMVFSVSYTVASVGPTVFGALRDATGGFAAPWAVLAALAVVQLVLIAPLRPTLPPV
jgi:CP family cyanate transporter-like MFS transporter